ncbi:hypothetical protein [Paenibacillus woosongensis]
MISFGGLIIAVDAGCGYRCSN